MKHAKHTPGPWELNDEDTSILALDSSNTWRCIATARTAVGIDGAANARLIAAAPEMLEALSAVLKRLELQESETPSENYLLAAMRLEIKALIARIEGTES